MRLTWRRALGALAALALPAALPAGALAVPSVYSVEAKTGPADETYARDATGANLTETQTRYVVTTDGFSFGYAETNGVTTDGVLDYSVLPATYRAPATAEQKLAFADAETGLQAHATCDVAALRVPATIVSWQTGAAGDPSYDYVPWQKTAAGLGDDPRSWLGVVRTATGVDLSALSTAAEFRAACEGLTGTYVPADTQSAIATALIANAVSPFQTQVASLQRQVASLQREVSTLRRAVTTARNAQRLAETTYQSFFTRPIELTLAAKRFPPRYGVALVTGAPTDVVRISVEVTRSVARRIGLSDRVLVETVGEINAEGAVLLTLKPDAETTALLDRWLSPRASRGRRARARTIAVKVLAVSGGNTDSARATLTR